ncbi:OLC1v1009628C3 [Oldenlandia corymbosa var. corymbosa]|uniref:OLC1v1009628C3 n=1 Tax=Oldenlandia corymbosa var. corymbosa TaxID=529605 RepID=A0AAV1DS28_OLDCO|nr:OLC1v1009628C3 [Oldenlandia corymbosa var. corymbosa]
MSLSTKFPGYSLLFVYLNCALYFTDWIFGMQLMNYEVSINMLQATFDQYLEDKPRVFRAIFPDRRRSRQLNEEEWRINMLPIEFLFLTVNPVIDMRVRYKSQGIDYPPGVPRDIPGIVELQIIRWELRGLDDVLKPSHFSLSVNGVLYPERRGARSRLKGKLEMSISFILPAALSLIPEEVRREVAESVLRRLLDNMKTKVNGSLLSDYSAFKREKSIKLV